MEFRWKFYENVKEVNVLFGLVLSLLMLNRVESGYYEVNLEEQPLYLYNDNYPNQYKGENNDIWKFYKTDNCIIEATCSIELNDNYSENVFLVNNGSISAYCGNNAIAFKGFNLTITFISTINSRGRFLCEIKTNTIPTCQCGRKKVTKIVGGEETNVNEYPCMAGLVDCNTNETFCGATIIAEQYVLTAAHCILNRNIDRTVIVVGEHDVTTGEDTNATKLYQIKKFIIHPEYNPNASLYNDDIAICKTTERIIFNAEVGPVCLPFNHEQNKYDIVTALGWGLTEFAGPKATALQKVKLNVISTEECQSYYGNNISNNMCTFTPGKDTCQMDSGGPLLSENSTNLLLEGIICMGFGCASNKPSMNVRVDPYVDWIVSVTPDAQYCKIE